MRLSKQGVPELALASNIYISRPGPTWRVELKRGLLWSDQTPVTVDNFITGWKKILQRKVRAPLASLLFAIKNAQDCYLGKSTIDQLGIKKINDHCMEITLEHPVPYFYHLLSSPIFFPIHKSFSEEEENPQALASCGPFQVAHYKNGKELLLNRNPFYWDETLVQLEEQVAFPLELQKFPVDQIRFIFEASTKTQLELLDSGKIDLCGSPFLSVSPSDLWEYPFTHDYSSRNIPELSTWMLVLNTEHPILKNLSMRRAISLSLMRERWVQQGVFSGEPCHSLVPGSLYATRKKKELKEDLLLARKLWRKGAKELGVSLEEINLELTYCENAPVSLSQERSETLSTVDSSIHKKRVQVIKDRLLNALGVHITLRPLERGAFRNAQQRGDFAISTLHWMADYPHALSFLELFSGNSEEYNFSKWHSESYSELLKEARETVVQKTQERLLHKAEKTLLAAYPVIPISHPGSPCFYNPCLSGIICHHDGSIDLRWAFTRDNTPFQ